MMKIIRHLVILKIIFQVACESIISSNYTDIITMNYQNKEYRISYSNKRPRKIYSTKYEDNNVTGTGNIMIDVYYRAKCDMLKCPYCCSQELNYMRCETKERCNVFIKWRKFLTIGIPLIIASGIFIIVFTIILIGNCLDSNKSKGEACAQTWTLICITFFFIFFIPLLICGVDIFKIFECCNCTCECFYSIFCCLRCCRKGNVTIGSSTTSTYISPNKQVNEVEQIKVEQNDQETVRPPNFDNFDSNKNQGGGIHLRETINDQNFNDNFQDVLYVNNQNENKDFKNDNEKKIVYD